VPSDRDRRILDVVRSLSPGEVVSYGDVAHDAGHARQSRLVGHLLASSDDASLPWWRVVASTGRLVPGLEREQAARLRAEGVEVTAGRVRRSPAGRFRQSP
jgi:alkylated DNA nucleotide flippase Atl1